MMRRRYRDPDADDDGPPDGFDSHMSDLIRDAMRHHHPRNVPREPAGARPVPAPTPVPPPPVAPPTPAPAPRLRLVWINPSS